MSSTYRKDGMKFVDTQLSKIQRQNYFYDDKCCRITGIIIFGILTIAFVVITYSLFHSSYDDYNISSETCILKKISISIDENLKKAYGVDFILYFKGKDYRLSRIHKCKTKDFCKEIIKINYSEPGKTITCFYDYHHDRVMLTSESSTFFFFLGGFVMITITIGFLICFMGSIRVRSKAEDLTYYWNFQKKFEEP